MWRPFVTAPRHDRPASYPKRVATPPIDRVGRIGGRTERLPVRVEDQARESDKHLKAMRLFKAGLRARVSTIGADRGAAPAPRSSGNRRQCRRRRIRSPPPTRDEACGGRHLHAQARCLADQHGDVAGLHEDLFSIPSRSGTSTRIGSSCTRHSVPPDRRALPSGRSIKT